MHNVLKWPDILLKSCGVHTARFLKYVWLFYNIMDERVKSLSLKAIHQRITFQVVVGINQTVHFQKT